MALLGKMSGLKYHSPMVKDRILMSNFDRSIDLDGVVKAKIVSLRVSWHNFKQLFPPRSLM